MGIFDRTNTFYNSTWHQYKLPSLSWKPTNPLVTQDGDNIKLNWNGYNHPQNSIVWNPFGLEQRSWTGYNPETGEYGTLPRSPGYVEPSQHSFLNPILPYKPYNVPSYYDYEDIYADENDDRKPVSSETLDKVRVGLGTASQVINALGQGRTTGAGEKDANYYINTIGKVGKNLPGVAGLVFSGIDLGSSLVNTLAGSSLNDNNIKAFKSAIQNRARWQMGDNSTTSALVGSSANNVDLKVPGVKYFGKDPLLSDILGYGVGKASGTAWAMKQPTAQANTQAHNTEALGYKDYQNKYIRRGLLTASYGLGGPISNRFDIGGKVDMNRMFTHGSLFSNGLTQINNGGSHEQNPYDGVQYGVDPYGIPNLVEEGETVFNAGPYGGPDSYSFSDRIKFPKKYANMFSTGSKISHKKGKWNETFADMSKLLSKESEERPNDEKSLRTLAKNLGKLAIIQEEVKARQQLEQMNPLDVMMALQQSPMADQMGAMQGMEEQPPMEGEQQPMMAACGGKLHAYGGNIFAGGGDTNNLLSTLGLDYLQQLQDFNLADYVAQMTDPTVYARRRRGRGRGRGRSAGGGSSTNVLNNQTYINGNAVNNIPDSLVLHDDLFQEAINDYIKGEYDKFANYKQQGKYDEAYQVAKKLNEDFSTIQTAYVAAMRDPTKDKIKYLQESFDKLGLNKNVDTYLSTKKQIGNKQDYPVYHYVTNKKGKKELVPQKTNKAVDSRNGVITQNMFIGVNPESQSLLDEMSVSTMPYLQKVGGWDSTYRDAHPEYIVTDSDPDYFKNLSMFTNRDIGTTRVIKNPKYTKDGDEPEFIPIKEDILRYAPKGTLDAENWWTSLDEGEQQKLIDKYYKANGDPIRSDVYENRQIYDALDQESRNQATTDSNSADVKEDEQQTYYIPKPRSTYESDLAKAVAGFDYLNSLIGEGRTPANPGVDAAYAMANRIGNIPLVRNHPVATKLSYRPSPLNLRLGNDINQEFGLLRNATNLNRGLTNAETLNMINKANEIMGQTRQQTLEEDDKRLQQVVSHNDQAELADAQGSLNAQEANAKTVAEANSARAQMYAQLANVLSSNYKNWLDYRNAQSSGYAQILHDQGYNKQALNLRDAAFLIYNQQPDVLNTLGIQYQESPYPYLPYMAMKNNKKSNNG